MFRAEAGFPSVMCNLADTGREVPRVPDAVSSTVLVDDRLCCLLRQAASEAIGVAVRVLQHSVWQRHHHLCSSRDECQPMRGTWKMKSIERKSRSSWHALLFPRRRHLDASFAFLRLDPTLSPPLLGMNPLCRCLITSAYLLFNCFSAVEILNIGWTVRSATSGYCSVCRSMAALSWGHIGQETVIMLRLLPGPGPNCTPKSLLCIKVTPEETVKTMITGDQSMPADYKPIEPLQYHRMPGSRDSVQPSCRIRANLRRRFISGTGCHRRERRVRLTFHR